MLFRSRQKPTLLRQVRRLIWPTASLTRSARYVWLRLFRLKASPHSIAVGCAAGVFASITPLIGFQMLMAGVIALLLRGSMAAAMLATFVGNPLTWPVFWALTYGAGLLLVGGPAVAAGLPQSADQVWPVVYTMLIGSIPVGLAAAAASYALMFRAAEVWQSEQTCGANVSRGFGQASLSLLQPDRISAAAGTAVHAAWRLCLKLQQFTKFGQLEPAWRLW